MYFLRVTSTITFEFLKRSVESLAEKTKQTGQGQLTEFSNFEGLDISGGFVCDMETGICGPAVDINIKKTNLEEKKNGNNSLV